MLMASGLLCWVQWAVLCMVVWWVLTSVSSEALAAVHLRDAFAEHFMSCPPLLLWAVFKCSVWFQLSFFFFSP